MAFWGVKLEPGKPYTHSYNSSLGRLRISQATLDILLLSSRYGYVAVQCKVGNMIPVSLCLLHLDNGSCMLDIELEEKDNDVVFEVIGPTSVHLAGFYLGHNCQSGNGAVGNYGARSTSQAAHVKTEFNVLEKGRDPEYKDTEVNGCRVRTMASGFLIEDMRTMTRSESMLYKPQIAYHGCYVEFRYFAQIKSTGYVFESHKPWKESFRLGKGELIKGLDDGINGIHVGDKRRLTVPPSMGYCGSKARSDVPADAWLVFEVELIEVRLTARCIIITECSIELFWYMIIDIFQVKEVTSNMLELDISTSM